MNGHSLHDRLIEALDLCAVEQSQIAQQFAAQESSSDDTTKLQNDLNELLDLQLERLVDLVADDAQGLRYAQEVSADHPYFREFLAQASLAASPHITSVQFSVDLDLLRAVSEEQVQAGTPYAIALRRYMLGLPSAESLRRCQGGLTSMLENMPEGTNVLALDCGPAFEVQSVLKRGSLGFSLDLFDRSARTMEYLVEHVRDPRIRYVHCSPLDMLTGHRRFPLYRPQLSFNPEQTMAEGASLELAASHYDLVYVRGLYNYISTHHSNPSRGVTGLTSVLFDLVKPGGRLVIGNCLTPGAANPHTLGARFLMEVIAIGIWSIAVRARLSVLQPTYPAMLIMPVCWMRA